MAPLRFHRKRLPNAQASDILQALNNCLQDFLFESQELTEKEALLLLREVVIILVQLREVQF